MSRSRSLTFAAALVAAVALSACSSVYEPPAESTAIGRLTDDQNTNDRWQQGQTKEHRGEKLAEEDY
ncbi:MAG: hypothetical protein OER21_13520 [Gemmatimonadota bacterium]|nr:hypothetical protein [Gemmatimonadota bacterium]